MKKPIFSAVVMLSLYVSPVLSDQCDSAPPKITRINLSHEIKVLDAKADEINAWWTQGRNHMELSEAIVERQRRIDKVYEDLATNRSNLYSALSCEFHSSKRCCSTPGKRKQCPMTVEPPSPNVEFGPLQINGDDFDQPPTLNDISVSYIVKKTGNGCNTGGFSTNVKYREGAIKKFVDEDIEIVRTYFQSKVALSPPDNQVTNHGGSMSSQCQNVASELSKLTDLRRNNDLSESEFNRLRTALINRCSG